MRPSCRPAKLALSIFCAIVLANGVGALAATWEPSAGHKQIALWPGAVPDAKESKGPEDYMSKDIEDGSNCSVIGRVSKPTLTVYSPKGKNTGVAVVVYPGGGFWILAMDLEGTEICDWLNSKGITAILVKYRVTGSAFKGSDCGKYPRSGPYPRSAIALQDAQRALGLTRYHAKEWNIDPHKIGVIGFSAGGHLSAAMSTHYPKRLYAPVDAADKVSCRPDFAAPIYPGHLWQDETKFVLNPDIHVTHSTPPTFIVQAENDPVDPVEHSLVYYRALRKAGVPVEMHLYAEGGHAFGLRPSKLPIANWTKLFETWLETIGMVPKENKQI